jgi:hypothetical protein
MVNYGRREIAMAELKPEDVKVTNLGRAKANSPMFKRGWTVNMMSNVPQEKPVAAPEPPAKPKRKKKPRKK